MGLGCSPSSDWGVRQGGSHQCRVLSTVIVDQPAHAHSSRVESRLLQPFCLSQRFSRQPRGLVSSMYNTRIGMPSLWLNLLAPQGKGPPIQTFSSFQIPLRGRGPNPTPFFPSYPVTWKSFLQLWLYRSSSASFQLVFHEQCSACRCIFNVFVAGGESSTSSYSAISIPPRLQSP